MKDIKYFNAGKYGSGKMGNGKYAQVDSGIFETGKGKDKVFVTSLAFVQEPKYGEGNSADNISQYPLEDILDKYYCYISDFYDDLNTRDSKVCYLEFASDDVEDIKKLRSIIGKHVYNKEFKKDDGTFVELIIE